MILCRLSYILQLAIVDKSHYVPVDFEKTEKIALRRVRVYPVNPPM